MFMTKPSV